MDATTTLAAAAVFAGLTALCGWRGSLPPNLIKGPRMMPWRMLMVTFAAVVLVLLVHLASLFGLRQDR